MGLQERNGGLYPAAHFCVREICISTNNVVYLQNIYQNHIYFYIIIRSVRLPERNGALHCTAIYDVYAIYNPTNNVVSIKNRTQLQNPHSIITPTPTVICDDNLMRNG